jgi:hypothetical protein
VEFSWEGNDECDPASGRGWAVLEEDGSLCGRIFFHLGDGPLPCWGWGDIPDQYGRRRDGDDGSSPMPKTPDGLADLPPILPGWGPRRARPAASPADGSSIRYRDLIT